MISDPVNDVKREYFVETFRKNIFDVVVQDVQLTETESRVVRGVVLLSKFDHLIDDVHTDQLLVPENISMNTCQKQNSVTTLKIFKFEKNISLICFK